MTSMILCSLLLVILLLQHADGRMFNENNINYFSDQVFCRGVHTQEWQMGVPDDAERTWQESVGFLSLSRTAGSC